MTLSSLRVPLSIPAQALCTMLYCYAMALCSSLVLLGTSVVLLPHPSWGFVSACTCYQRYFSFSEDCVVIDDISGEIHLCWTINYNSAIIWCQCRFLLRCIWMLTFGLKNHDSSVLHCQKTLPCNRNSTDLDLLFYWQSFCTCGLPSCVTIYQHRCKSCCSPYCFAALWSFGLCYVAKPLSYSGTLNSTSIAMPSGLSRYASSL